jgi:hypothetical protein
MWLNQPQKDSINMTTAARQVLEDCQGALSELVDGVRGPTWRRRWVIAIVLLRAVGHVLDKVDGTRSPELRKAITKWWQDLRTSKPKPEIFWLFIEEERNTIIKEYQTNAGQGVTVFGQGFTVNMRTGQQEADFLTPPKPPIYHYTMNAGHFKAQDQRELIDEAIQWWENELNSIDLEAKQQSL